MKVFTRPQGPTGDAWDVIIWSNGAMVTIPTFDQRHAAILADLLVTLIRTFGPNEVSQVE